MNEKEWIDIISRIYTNLHNSERVKVWKNNKYIRNYKNTTINFVCISNKFFENNNCK